MTRIPIKEVLPDRTRKLRSDFETIPEITDPQEMLLRKEFDKVVDIMKKSKAPDMDKIPAEI